MNSAEKQAVLHCLRSMIDEEVCEECPLYGTTGTDHCEKDCVRLAIKALEQEPILDKIRTEIEEKENKLGSDRVADVALKTAYIEVLKIIDKYRQEG